MKNLFVNGMALIGKVTLTIFGLIIGISMGAYAGQRIIKCRIMMLIRKKRFEDYTLLKMSYKYILNTSMGKPLNFRIAEKAKTSPEYLYAKELFEYTKDVPFSQFIFKNEVH